MNLVPDYDLLGAGRLSGIGVNNSPIKGRDVWIVHESTLSFRLVEESIVEAVGRRPAKTRMTPDWIRNPPQKGGRETSPRLNLGLDFLELGFEDAARGNYAALLGDPGTELAVAGTFQEST